MYNAYRVITYLFTPFIPLLLKRRLRYGKEDAAHLQERAGVASAKRPQGKVLWIHAASVGESNAVLPLIHALLATFPSLSVLLTTVTVTSANMMRERLPERAFHQFAPVDTPGAVAKFLEHWQPDIALWVDSEFWPNIIMETKKRGAVMGIVNARMSSKSFRSWQFAKPFVSEMLKCFTLCFAQSGTDSERLLQLGIPAVTGIGNLKYDAPALPFDKGELERLRQGVRSRPVWVAASTHPGEEKIIAEVHKSLKPAYSNVLTVIVPRHAKRGNEIASELGGLNVAQRSKQDSIKPDTDIYLADTMGELGLFYRLAPIAFIGGTLVPHGGQNPLEAARIGCAIITGQYASNFDDIVREMEKDKAIIRIAGEEELVSAVKNLMQDREACRKLKENATAHARSKDGTIHKIMNALQSYLG